MRIQPIIGKLMLLLNYVLGHQKVASSSKSILEQYITSRPSPQNALDIFQGEWSSKLPAPLAGLRAGTLDLFDDPRIKWLAEEIRELKSKTVLELGPLEGGHSYMLERLGAAQIVAIEANTRAYLKCLIVKELLNLQRTQFLCGDFVEYLREEGSGFDLCVASGVLYHMRNPAELIALLSARCTGYLFLWTHYYEPTIISDNPVLSLKFTGSHPDEYRGFRHMLYRQEYWTALDSPKFCGGSAPYSFWMGRDDLFECLQHFGLGNFRTNFDHPYHPNGPAIAIIAERTR